MEIRKFASFFGLANLAKAKSTRITIVESSLISWKGFALTGSSSTGWDANVRDRQRLLLLDCGSENVPLPSFMVCKFPFARRQPLVPLRDKLKWNAALAAPFSLNQLNGWRVCVRAGRDDVCEDGLHWV